MINKIRKNKKPIDLGFTFGYNWMDIKSSTTNNEYIAYVFDNENEEPDFIEESEFMV